VFVKNMSLDFAQCLMAQMQQVPAGFTFQMQMPVAVVIAVDVLIAAPRYSIGDEPPSLAALQ
jgi:hypothetical protein